MRRFLLVTHVCGLFGTAALQAQDLGCKGNVFPVAEDSLVRYLQKEAEAISWEKRNQILADAKQQLLTSARTPRTVPFLKETEEKRIFHLDLSYQAQEEIRDDSGGVIIRKGQMINPLKTIFLSSCLLFFDGENQEHIAWAKRQTGRVKWILVKGSPTLLEEKELRAVYFDQGGRYSTLFQLERIPARISQDGDLLLIEEIPAKQKILETKQQSNELLHAEIDALIAQSVPSSDSLKRIGKNPLHEQEAQRKCPRSFSLAEETTPSELSLSVFISFSVPMESWKWLSKELEQIGGTFVLNGIPNGSFHEFALKIQALRKDGINAPIQIDPLGFEQYQIKQVPTVIVSDGKTFDKVSGNIPLRTALDLFIDSGSFSEHVKQLMIRQEKI